MCHDGYFNVSRGFFSVSRGFISVSSGFFLVCQVVSVFLV